MKKEIASNMHRLFRRLQQKNKFIKNVSATGLSLIETHVLIELQAKPTHTIASLSQLCGIDQSSGSRLISNLIKKNLIKSKKSKKDARKRVLEITVKGIKLIEENDKFQDALIKEFSANLSQAEMDELVNLFKLIADGYGHPRGTKRKEESQYRVEQRRITRCFGLLGEHVFQSKLSSSSWQALAEIVLAPVSPKINELSELLGLAQNSLSTILEKLNQDGLIKRKQSPNDKREFIFIAKEEGRREYAKIEQQAAEDLLKALNKISELKAKKYLELLTLFVGEQNAIYPPLLPNFYLKEVTNRSELQVVRGHALRFLIEKNFENQIPETCISQKNRIFIVKNKDKTQAVLEYQLHKKNAEIKLAAWSNNITPWLMISFINASYQKLNLKTLLKLEQLIDFKPLEKFIEYG